MRSSRRFLRSLPVDRSLLACVCLLICSCREKPGAGLPPALPGPSPAPSASPGPVPVPAAIRATPEQIGSVLRVRVAFGGLPARDSVAALLHREEIPDQSLARGNARFVLTSLKGWEEAQMRGAGARIIVYRDKVNPAGQTATVSFPARLVQLDAATGLGVLAYSDDFDYAADVGFHLPRGGPTPADAILLRTFQNAASPEMPLPNRLSGAVPSFSVDAGTYRRSETGEVSVRLPTLDPSAAVDPVQLAVSAPDLLVGLVETTPGGPVLTPLNRFKVALKPPQFDVARVTFDNPYTEGQYRISLTVVSGSGDPVPGRLQLHTRETPPSAMRELLAPDAAGTFRPLSDKPFSLWQQSGPGGSFSTNLPEPVMDRQTFYLMQLSWPLLPGQEKSPEVYGPPFVVKIERRPGGLYPAVLEQPPAAADAQSPALAADADHGQPAAAPDAARFPLGAAARDVHLMAGGREALIHLDGAPYWKRFSFVKNDWLPLPPGPLTNASLTGSLTALYVLDRDLREVRKFALPGLEPLGAARLPPADCLAVLAGGDSGHAPVFVTTPDGALTLDPATLQPRHTPPPMNPWPAAYANEPATCFITGDGLGFWRVSRNAAPFFHYNGDTRGLEHTYLGVEGMGPFDGVPGVTGGFSLGDGLRTRDTPGGVSVDQGHPSAPWTYAPAELSENAPVVFRLLRPARREVPSRPPRLGCFAFPGALPFAEVDVPELADLTDNQLWKRDRWAFLDPYSERLATLSADRRTWFTRPLSLAASRSQPVLLNWPDTTVDRGGKFSFQPRLAGGTKFSAEVLGKTSPPAIDEAAGTLSWPIAAREFDSLQLLTLKVPGSDDAPFAYPMTLHVAGPELPFAAPPTAKAEGLNQRGAGLAALGASNRDFLPFAAALYPLPDPVTEIQGPVAGCAVLITAANRVDFFSLQARRMVGSVAGPPGAWYYPGAGALLEYDPGKRTLSRLSVPEGRREQTLSLPPNTTLAGIGVGVERGSPVTLAVNVTQAQSVLRFSDLTLTNTAFHQFFVVLDGLTLRTGGRAQPTSLLHLLGKKDEATANFIGTVGTAEPRPVTIPASRDGCMVSLPRHFLALGANYAVVYPFEQSGPFGVDLSSFSPGLSGGSLTGLMAFSGSGQAYKGGAAVGTANNGGELGATPDGLYQLTAAEAGTNDHCLDIRLAESGRPLLRMARLPFQTRDQMFSSRSPRRMLMLGDTGPLGIVSATGQALELVDLDIPAAASLLAPEELHVVSQPAPFIMEGRTLEYQVRVNNPSALQSIRLQGEVPGVTLFASGRMSYTAPSAVSGPTHVNISIEVKGRNGQVALHEFPIYVLPFPRAGFKGKPGEI